MKKLITIFLVCTLCLSVCFCYKVEDAKAYVIPETDISLVPMAAADKAPISFSEIFTYNGKVYANDRLRISGWGKVPSEAECFAIYNGYIYYLKHPGGTGVSATSLYRCNLDGTKKKLLTTKISPWSSYPVIVNNILYYNGGDDDSELYNGVFSLDLATLKIKRFLSSDCNLAYCSDDYLYFNFQYSSLYRIKFNGSGKTRISPVNNSEDIGQRVLYGNYIYFANDGFIYRALSDGTKKAENLSIPMGDNWVSFNVVNDCIICYYDGGIYKYKLDGSNKQLLTTVEKKIYFAHSFTIVGDMLYFVESGDIVQEGDRIYTDFFYRIPINGGRKEYLNIRWFTS